MVAEPHSNCGKCGQRLICSPCYKTDKSIEEKTTKIVNLVHGEATGTTWDGPEISKIVYEIIKEHGELVEDKYQ